MMRAPRWRVRSSTRRSDPLPVNLKQKELGVVIVSLALGAILRGVGLGWGLPDLFEEATPLRKAWGM